MSLHEIQKAFQMYCFKVYDHVRLTLLLSCLETKYSFLCSYGVDNGNIVEWTQGLR